MKAEELFEHDHILFENYNQLEKNFNEALGKYGGSSIVTSAIKISGEVGIIRMGGSLVEAFKTLVKKNMLFEAKKPSDKDASHWAASFKQIVEMNNSVYADSVIDDFAYLVYFSVEEIRERNEAKEGKNDYKVIHKESSWVMFKVEHKNAACSLGSGTRWCISARGDRNFFDDYVSRGANVYMIHTRSEKFAILVRKGSKEIMEVQTSSNTHGHPEPSVIKDFAKKMTDAGVDVDKVEDILGVTMIPSYSVESIEFVLGQDGVKPTPKSSLYTDIGVYKANITITGKGGFREKYEDSNMIFVANMSGGGSDVAFMDTSALGRPHKMYLMGEINSTHPAIALMARNSDLFTNPDKEDRYLEMLKNTIKRDLGVSPYKKLISTDELLAVARGDS